MLPLLWRRDEDVQDLITFSQQDHVGVPSGELEEEGPPTCLGVELKEDEPVAADLLDPPQRCSGELRRDPLIERSLGTRVALDPIVLEVETPSLRLAREVDPEDRHSWAVWSRDQGEDCVLGGPRLHIAEGGPLEEPS